ncbi:SAM-dependent methyltransferase [Paenibacillus sp. 598K]|uniref:class I SAM-dependent methyltransferase n=1 Tax=Paenibacillus sp. 598K TaxID=1117987 RepID=UPI000FFA2E28|nr:class I SAM-dependent methyltransferase [Paenibacillus sp. 598K]GBF77872.1 SAM-dependent methyltransferase [Paenibacillus sp. 598K]
MSNHEAIYRSQAEQYEYMVGRQPELDEVIKSIRPATGLDVVDLGAGTGRMSRYLASEAASYTATDLSAAMLEVLQRKAEAGGYGARVRTVVADHRELPLADDSADLVVSGWSIGYLASAKQPEWQDNLARVMTEARRILRPGGTMIIFETLGTGVDEAVRLDFLVPYYEQLETHYRFEHQAIRMDYPFESVEEAAQACGFFFGDWLAERIIGRGWSVVPEHAGVWWRHDFCV